MCAATKRHDISDELYIQKFSNGVKLVQPEVVYQSSFVPGTNHTLGHTNRLPFSFCLLNTESEILRMNHAGAALNGFASEIDVVGKSLFDLYEHDNAQSLRNDDIVILQTERTCINENNLSRKDGVQLHNLTIDAPWYDEDDKLVGLLGFSVVIGSEPIEPALNYLRELGLLTPFIAESTYPVSLTNREKTCLNHLLVGKSYKQIASTLQLSPRTVEHCIDRIKSKFNVKTRYQLIEAVRSQAQ